MKTHKLAIFAASAFLVAGTVAQAAEIPSATATFTADTVAVGLGYSWGHGQLTYEHHTYPFTVKGLSAVGAGADKVVGVAEVYNLKALSQFKGVYGSADVGGAIGKTGGGTAVLKNDKGVVVRLHTKSKGLEVNLAVSGVDIDLPGS